MFNSKKSLLVTSLFVLAGAANASYEIKLSDEDTITFGGYIQGDIRYIDGNASSSLVNDDFWIGHVTNEEISNTRFSASSTRFNTKYVHGDITGFIEMDFYGGDGNEKLTNSRHPRLRHAFIKYKNWTVGQTWSTFINTSALAEAADFGGPLVASGFIRQDLVRYTVGGFQMAIENPESYGGSVGSKGYGNQDSVPDVIGKYTFKGDWGNVAIAAVARQLTSVTDNEKSALGYGITGRVKTFGKDDFRFQFHGGNTGRYVGAAAATDIVGEEVEETTAIMVAYRHFWSDDLRSNVFYGNTETKETDRDRTHWGINIFKNITPKLSYGIEIGNFEAANLEDGADSDYAQVSIKYVL
jgi:hypothetical protein